ncbi:IucA/IucC family protein [Micromonospora endolithica]|uniref:IucA/IucC family siderophore biosynthesis protein n=1 Tax=Micromonospora endolithica TaxID=230091 RepID=A0A3A9ZKB6_9ACTN|nr:IucA/IucC family protein [Micromonospora endolithica]RKN47766.1 IucA/IucC family siderophore biosynthesis protein [Micromonospora endolithica]TWJ21442.1 siderophore synthetase component [Micromonospora endolithica]
MTGTGLRSGCRRDTDRRADLAAAHGVLGCLVREVALPDGDAAVVGDTLRLRLRHLDVTLRCAVARVSPIGAHRYRGAVQRRTGGDRWEDLDSAGLAGLVAAELRVRTGVDNEEFPGQVRASRDAVGRLLADRPARDPTPTGEPAVDAYVDSEQSLVLGHPYHPTPKWRSGDPDTWRAYAPELRTAFRLHWLAVPDDLVADAGPFDPLVAALDPPRPPAGHRALPVHPWQLSLVPPTHLRLRRLGAAGVPVRPTASVRTLYAPEADLFVKASLHVRITNCLRKNARYELTGAVALSDLLSRVPLPAGVALLTEPAYRTVDLPGADEAYGTILRTGVRPHLRPGQIPLLAAALAAGPLPVADPVAWWRAYVGLLVPAVLGCWLRHGVVHEAHLQNVVVVLDRERRPVRMLLRDLEGVKLETRRWSPWPRGVPPEVGYRPSDARNRIVYCLFVNHLAGVCGALADARPGIETLLWQELRAVVAAVAADLGEPPELRALLRGRPLTAKANLLVRWRRDADRAAVFVPVPNPFGGPR